MDQPFFPCQEVDAKTLQDLNLVKQFFVAIGNLVSIVCRSDEIISIQEHSVSPCGERDDGASSYPYDDD